jgi:hypothetical protein
LSGIPFAVLSTPSVAGLVAGFGATFGRTFAATFDFTAVWPAVVFAALAGVFALAGDADPLARAFTGVAFFF